MNHLRLRKDSDFKNIYRNGKSLDTKTLVFYFIKNDLGYTRVGYSISKKVGKAVTRNRIRRLIKENLKDIPDLKDGYDIIFIGRIPSSESDYKEIGKSIRYLFRKSGVL